jgi:hypothetical protein
VASLAAVIAVLAREVCAVGHERPKREKGKGERGWQDGKQGPVRGGKRPAVAS